MQVGDLVRYKSNAFMGEVTPADYGVGIVMSIFPEGHLWENSVIRVQLYNVKTKYNNSARQTNDCLYKLEVVSENR